MADIYNLSAINSSSLDLTYSGISTQAPWLFPLLLFFEFGVIFLAGLYAQHRKVNYANVPMWGTIAGMVTTTSAFLYSAISGIISIATVGTCIAVTLGFALLFFLLNLDE